jgi:prepilin-type N-terminal cleavage/methylation domain-containing protein
MTALRHRAPDRSAAPSGRRNSGFTLVELIISIALIGMVAAVGTSILKDTLTATTIVNANAGSAGRARYALERLAREIREVKYDGGQYCINTMNAARLVYYKTSGTYNSNCAANAVTVTINSSGASLTLGYSSPAVVSTLSNDVDANGLRFVYYRSDGTTVANNAADVQIIQITLTVRDPATGVQSTAQRTRVALRNS